MTEKPELRLLDADEVVIHLTWSDGETAVVRAEPGEPAWDVPRAVALAELLEQGGALDANVLQVVPR